MGVETLRQAGILTRENRQALIQILRNGHENAIGVAARSMILLNNNDQLTRDRLAEIVRRPHNGLLLALQDGTGFSREEPVDDDVANLRPYMRVLGEASRQNSLVNKIASPILGRIGFFAACSPEHESGVDKKTAAVIAPALLGKRR